MKNQKEFYLPIIYEERVLALVDEKTVNRIDEILPSLEQTKSLQIAMSMVSVDPFSLPVNYRQALFAMKKAARNSGIYKCEEFTFDYLWESFREMEMTQTLIHSALQILMQYDEINNTELYKTLQVFLDHEKNYLETAHTLHVHRNTLKYRLGRIVELTGISLDSEEELKYLLSPYFM